MKETLKILYIEDEKEPREKLVKLLQSETINGYEIEISGNDNFDTSIEFVSDYQMVILDIFKGKAGDGGNASGEEVLREIQQSFFVPVIFYSGNVESVKHLRSQVIGVVTKGDEGVDGLKKEIERLTKHNLPFLKEKIRKHLEEELRKYFWDVIQKENNIFVPNADDYSLGYLLLRNFANSLSKENIAKIIGDTTIQQDKVHPMEFYIYPIDDSLEFENGEIIKKNGSNDYYAILTPSCDFIARPKRKAEFVLLVKSILLTSTQEYKTFLSANSKQKEIARYEEQLKELCESENNCESEDSIEKKKKDLKEKIEKSQNKLSSIISSFSQFLNSGKSDRYFFLPGTPFIENRVLDFQNKEVVNYSSLKESFHRVTKLDSPFAQSMMSSFIRYYNRIGFPDIDTEYVINHLNI